MLYAVFEENQDDSTVFLQKFVTTELLYYAQGCVFLINWSQQLCRGFQQDGCQPELKY